MESQSWQFLHVRLLSCSEIPPYCSIVRSCSFCSLSSFKFMGIPQFIYLFTISIVFSRIQGKHFNSALGLQIKIPVYSGFEIIGAFLVFLSVIQGLAFWKVFASGTDVLLCPRRVPPPCSSVGPVGRQQPHSGSDRSLMRGVATCDRS